MDSNQGEGPSRPVDPDRFRVLTEQLRAEQRIAELSRRFLALGGDGFEAGIRVGLQAAAEIVGADRAQFFASRSERSRYSGIFEWCDEGIPGRAGLGGFEEVMHDYEWSRGELESGRMIRAPRVSELPAAAEPERRSLERSGVRSYLAIPIQRDGRAIGFLDVFSHRVHTRLDRPGRRTPRAGGRGLRHRAAPPASRGGPRRDGRALPPPHRARARRDLRALAGGPHPVCEPELPEPVRLRPVGARGGRPALAGAPGGPGRRPCSSPPARPAPAPPTA